MDAKLTARIRAELFRSAGYPTRTSSRRRDAMTPQRVTKAKSCHKAVELGSNGPLFIPTPDYRDSHKVYYGMFLYLIRSDIYVNLLPNEIGLACFSGGLSTAATSDP